MITALRGVEAVLRNSLFRSWYELLFVPMDAGMRRRAKAVLDVVADRTGEAVGSGIMQLVLLAGVACATSSLLTATIVLSGASFAVGRRFGPLYVGLIENQLLRYDEAPQVSMVSEAGWTLVQFPGDMDPCRVRRVRRCARRVDHALRGLRRCLPSCGRAKRRRKTGLDAGRA